MELGLSQEGLAEKLGISYQQVQKYEKGSTGLTIWRLQQIAGALQVSLDFFIGETSVVRESSPMYGGLSTKERRLLRAFRSLSKPSVQKSILEIVQAISNRGYK